MEVPTIKSSAAMMTVRASKPDLPPRRAAPRAISPNAAISPSIVIGLARGSGCSTYAPEPVPIGGGGRSSGSRHGGPVGSVTRSRYGETARDVEIGRRCDDGSMDVLRFAEADTPVPLRAQVLA